jgi:hypothetical protein
MKRNLIAVIAILGFAATAAFAEPALQSDQNVWKGAPEATSVVADSRAMEEGIYSFNQ